VAALVLRQFEFSVISCSLVPGTILPKMQPVHLLTVMITPQNSIEICSVFVQSKRKAYVGLGHWDSHQDSKTWCKHNLWRHKTISITVTASVRVHTYFVALNTTRSSPHHVAQHRPTGSETTPSYAPRSSSFGSELPSVEDDVDVWHYAIVSCMPEMTTTEYTFKAISLASLQISQKHDRDVVNSRPF